MSIDREWLASIIDDDSLGLLELPAKRAALSPDDRLVAGFQEICAFIEVHGRPPAENLSDMEEFKLHARLQGILSDAEHRAFLADFDTVGVLVEPEAPTSLEEAIAQDAAGLLSMPNDDLFTLRHVPADVKQPDRVAKRKPCEDFGDFRQLFVKCHAQLRTGERRLIPFRNESQISAGSFFVYRGVLTYVAEVGELTRAAGRPVARLRCIFENETEGDLLLRSLARELYKDGRRVTEPSEETLERMGLEPGTEMGFVYVLRSLSTDPQVTGVPDLHKIGFTKRSTGARVKQANDEKTYLRAPVELVAEYSMPATIVSGVEATLHKFFALARIDVSYRHDGEVVSEATEWFSVPRAVIDEAVDLISVEAITDYQYDPEARMIRLKAS